jgi:heparosan-N-sulfate-glucuronate 5-epimerase
MDPLRHVRSAFSLGAGYETTPIGQSFEKDSVRGYFIDFTAKTTSSSANTPEMLIPAGLAQLGLGWWERILRGESIGTERFLAVCNALEQRAVAERHALLWPSRMMRHKYPPLSPYSALPQAQVVSVFIRAFLLTDESRWKLLAVDALRPLLAHSSSELVFEADAGPVLEECVTDPPSHILNGWIYALWGLWEAKIVLEHEGAGETFELSLACLRSMVDAYDVGWWTRYSLYPHLLPDLAKPFYHTLHAAQIEVLHRLFDYSEFAEAARRWRAYDTLIGRARAVG